MQFISKREKVTNFIAKLDKSDNTKKTYLWALDRYFDIVGDAPLDVESYEKFLMGIRSHSPSTKRILRVAVMKYYEYHDATHPRLQTLNRIYSRKARKKSVSFDYEGVKKLISHCDNLRGDLMSLRDRAFILTLADTGLRISELAALKRGDIDWNERQTVITGKGEKVALVRFSDRSIDALQEYLHMRAKMDGESKKFLNSLPLFAQHGRINRTKAMSVDGMRQSLVMRMEEAGARVRVHDLRHYFVTYILKATGNLKTAQVLARHESESTTLLYAHLIEGEDAKAYDEIFNR
jgi:integrase/recombinase XerC